MARLNEKTKEMLWNVLIIAVGLLLSFAVLMRLCTLAVGGPVALVTILMAMMGPN